MRAPSRPLPPIRHSRRRNGHVPDTASGAGVSLPPPTPPVPAERPATAGRSVPRSASTHSPTRRSDAERNARWSARSIVAWSNRTGMPIPPDTAFSLTSAPSPRRQRVRQCASRSNVDCCPPSVQELRSRAPSHGVGGVGGRTPQAVQFRPAFPIASHCKRQPEMPVCERPPGAGARWRCLQGITRYERSAPPARIEAEISHSGDGRT